MHERAFKSTISYPFPCMVFALCSFAGVHVCHNYVIKTPPCQVYIEIIRDEDNDLAPNGGPHIEVHPLLENLEAMVKQVQGANPATSVPTDNTPVESIQVCSTTPNSYCSIPSSTLVLLTRVQKLDEQMATLLHHIQPLMQRSIIEAEQRIDRNMSQHTERKIIEVHQYLDIFEL